MDTQFNLDALCSLFKDKARTTIGLLDTGDFPYNVYGELKSGFHYNTVVSGKPVLFVENVSVANINSLAYYRIRDINPEINFGIIDFEVSISRYPRQ